MKRSALIIGGGVIGAACAHYLSADDAWEVTIIDQGRFAGACSHGNCGFICPSHVLPLAEPGAIRKTFKAMLSGNSAFRVKPRFDLALWSWLLKFARRCNHHDMMSAGRALQPLLESSIALYRGLVERAELDCQWQEKGLLFAYRDAAQLDAYAPTNRLLADEFHHGAERLDARAAVELEPALKPDIAGAWYFRDDAHVRPDRLMASWRALLEARGVKIIEQCSFRSFEARGGRAAAAETTNGVINADAFILATGAWTPLLQQHLGCKIPIQPGKGYSLTMPRPARCPAIPLIFPETKVAITPMHDAYRIGSTMEFAGYDCSIDPQRLQLLRDGAAPYLHEPLAEPVEEQWYGWRPMTPDSLPIIGFAPKLENVVIAAGHNMIGMSTAPATGKLVAEMLAGGATHIDAAAFRVR